MILYSHCSQGALARVGMLFKSCRAGPEPLRMGSKGTAGAVPGRLAGDAAQRDDKARWMGNNGYDPDALRPSDDLKAGEA